MNTQPSIARLLLALARTRPGTYVQMSVILIFIPYLFNLVPGLVARAVFDQLSGQTPAGFNIASVLAVLVGSALAINLLTIYGFWLEGVIITHVETLLRHNLLSQIFARPGARALPASSGEAISRFRDDPRALTQFLTFAPDLPIQAIVLLISLAILAQIDLLFTLAVFVPLLATIVAVNLATKHIRRYRQANQEAIGAVTGTLGEIFAAVQAIKLVGAEQHVVRFFHTVNERRRHAALRDTLLLQSIGSFAANVANVAIGLLLLLAAQSLGSRGATLSVGDLALFVTYLTSLAGLIGFFGEILTRYRQTEVSFQRQLALLPDAPPSALVQTPTPLPPAAQHLPAKTALETLAVEGLRYCYPGTTHGIRNASFRLRRGTLTVITGRIGSGKTTLLRALLGLLPAQEGRIVWNDQLVDDPATFFVPPHSAYVSQTPRLFSETLRQNLLQGWHASEHDLAVALQQAVFEHDLAQLPEGLETLVGPRGARLSGGQLQRAAAARMFVRQPALLVCDDLSSALDATTEQTLWAQVRADRAATCLAVSHRRPVLRQADQIIVLHNGQIEAIGTLDTLLRESAELQHIWQHEAQDRV